MMLKSNLGCCGRSPLSLAGLLETADNTPANTQAGRAARQRLAYMVIAGKAAQAGNDRVRAQAMRGALRGLGTFTPDALDTHAAAARAEAAVTAATAPAAGPTLQEIGGTIQSVATLLTTVTDLGANIGAAAGGDAAAIRATHTITSWIRAIVNGTPPTIPPLDAGTLNDFVAFCGVATPVLTVLNLAFTGVIGVFATNAVTAAANRQAPNPSEATAIAVLGVVQERINSLVTGLCAAVTGQAAAAAATPTDYTEYYRTQCAAGLVGGVPAAEPGHCTCSPGYTNGVTPGVCTPLPPPTPGAPPLPQPTSVPIVLTAAQRRGILDVQTRVRSGGQLPSNVVRLIQLNPSLYTTRAGTLDPVSLCRAGEVPNPATGICDGGVYGRPPVPSSGGGKLIPLAAGAAALWFLFK